MNPMKILLGATAALVFGMSFLPQAQAAKPDFSTLAGKYKATYQLTSGSTSIPGNVVVTVTVPKNGRKAAIQIVGFGSIGGTGSIALLGNLVLKSNRSITADNALLAFYIQDPATPTRFAGSKNKLTFTLASNSVALGNSSIAYTLTFNGKRLSIVGNGFISGTSPISIAVTGKKHGK
jgi:hypothetical protein